MGRRSFAVSLALALLLANGMAQTAPANSKEIHQLYLDDQADRGVSLEGTKKKKATPDDVAANDSARRKRTHRLLEQGALQTGADFHDAAFIFQHGDQPEDYLLAHVLAMAAVAKGEPRGRWIAAATLDRYLHSIGQPQVFGTQYLTRGYLEFLQDTRAKQAATKENPDAQAGKPQAVAGATADQDAKKWDEYLQEPYESSLISDALRAQYCVPGRSDQKERLAELNGGKPSPRKPIPGCSK